MDETLNEESKSYRFASGAAKSNAPSNEDKSKKQKKLSDLGKSSTLSESSSLSFVEEIFVFQGWDTFVNKEELGNDKGSSSEDSSSMLSIEKIMLENKS